MQKPSYIAVKEFLVNSPEESPKGIFLLAHGAGRGAVSPFFGNNCSRCSQVWCAGGEIQLSLHGGNVENREKEITQ